MSIRFKMIGINLAVAGVVCALIGHLMLREWNDLRTFRQASEAATAVSEISRATIELSLERSLSQVALNLDERISNQLRSMLDRQRTLSDGLFQNARDALSSSASIDDREAYTATLDGLLEQIRTLRDRVDRQAAVPLGARSPEAVIGLPNKIKSLVSDLDELSFEIRSLMREATPDVLATDLVIQRAWAIREYGGRERTIFAIATARREPISDKNLIYMSENHGYASQAWTLMKRGRENPLLSEDVREGIGTLDRVYFQDYNDLRLALLAAAGSGVYPVDFESLFERSEMALQTAISLLNLAVESNHRNVNQALDQARTVLMLFGGLAILVLALLVATIWYLTTNIVGAIQMMNSAMETLAAGDTGIAVPGEERRDEIGAMAKALGTFKENALERAQLEKARQGDEAAKAERQRHVDDAIKTFEKAATATIDSAMEASRGLQSAAASLSNDAQGAIKQSETVTQAAETASGNVQRVAASAEELSRSILSIGEQVNEAASMSETSTSDAEQSSERVQSLSEAAQKIGDIVSIIQEIAEQTNLLALNATIEAARAGETGKGFAVVAAEVKALASQTAKATEQIAEQVNAVQSATYDTVKAIDTIAKSSRSVTEIAAAVTSSVKEQGNATTEIAQNVQHAADGTQDVTKNIVGVSNAAISTGNSADQVLAASDALAQQSEKLEASISEFLQAIRAA